MTYKVEFINNAQVSTTAQKKEIYCFYSQTLSCVKDRKIGQPSCNVIHQMKWTKVKIIWVLKYLIGSS